MSEAERVQAAEAYIRAIRTGEGSAATRAAQCLADDVVLTVGSNETKGKLGVTTHVTGVWPNTPVYQMGAWDDPLAEGDEVTVVAEFPSFGSGPSAMKVTFHFNAANEIDGVNEEISTNPRPTVENKIPLYARGLIANALANGTPMVVAYVNEAGEVELSLRGSTQVYSPTQLCIWLRNAEGGLAAAPDNNPNISLLYRDSKNRSTLIVKGQCRIDTDEQVRARVYALAPEVEQLHDPDRHGAALMIDVQSVRGGTARGGVNVQV